MANLYLIDQPFGGNGLALAQHDDEAIIVLVQDGVNLDVSTLGNGNGHHPVVYAVKKDLERRGLTKQAAHRVKPIDFGELVDLIVAHKVINFA
jgi:sulfur relay protein TusB/DsrH